MKKKLWQKNIKSKCQICGQLVLVDSLGQGYCENCGWHLGEMQNEFPDRVISPNLVSLNKAKKLAKEGKKLEPSIEDFAGMYMFYGEVEFTYKGELYQLCSVNGDGTIEYGCCPEDIVYFKTTEDFINNAKVFDGKLLKDVWSDVENPNYT